MEAAERYMVGQRLGRMPEAVIDNLHDTRVQLEAALMAEEVRS